MSYLIPAIVGAAIGFSTNWLAIKMLFWPRRPIIILGRRLPLTPGLLVARKGELAKAIAGACETQFADPDHLVKVALQANDSGKIWEAVKGSPMLARVWRAYVGEISRERMAEHVIMISGKIKDSGALKNLVEERVLDMHVDEVEEMVIRIAERELQAITIFGALLGAVVGLIQPFVGMMVGG